LSRHPQITLRYFDARGRAQFIRHYLRLRDIPFADERVPISADFAAWRELKGDRARTGPFEKLPVLHWGNRTIAETLMISAFLHEALGDARQLRDDDNLRHGMLTSSLAGDVMAPLAILLWADLAYVGVDLVAASKRTLERLHAHFGAVERSLNEWQWFQRMQKRPIMLADCLLWEELDCAKRVFGPHLALGTTPNLARFHEEFAGREACETDLRENPRPITARPQEDDVIAKIQAALG
jgi:hypothetical protein